MAEATPGPSNQAATPPRDIPAAVEHVKRMMQPDGPSENAPTETRQAKQPAQDSSETEQPVKEGTEAESEQAEPTEERDELPETLDEIAEALGVKTDDLVKKLKVSTKEGKATVADLLEGQLRDADYRKKTMELADTRRQVEAQATQYLETIKQRAESVSNLEALMVNSLQLANNELERMRRDEYTDPMAYERAKAARDEKLQILNTLAYQRQAAQQQAQYAQVEQAKQLRAREQESLLKEYPELRDNAKQTAFQNRLATYLSEARGMTRDEIASYFSGSWDHRHIGIIKDAADRYFDKKQSKDLIKKLAEKPKVATPGSSTQTSAEGRQQSTAGLREKLRHARTKGRRVGMALAQELVKAQLSDKG